MSLHGGNRLAKTFCSIFHLLIVSNSGEVWLLLHNIIKERLFFAFLESQDALLCLSIEESIVSFIGMGIRVISLLELPKSFLELFLPDCLGAVRLYWRVVEGVFVRGHRFWFGMLYCINIGILDILTNIKSWLIHPLSRICARPRSLWLLQ